MAAAANPNYTVTILYEGGETVSRQVLAGCADDAIEVALRAAAREGQPEPVEFTASKAA